MKKYVILTVSFKGYSRYEEENMIIEEEIYNSISEELDEVLENVNWSDFSGKHGHVDGEFTKKIITEKELISLGDSAEVDGFSVCWDSITDDLYDKELIIGQIRDSISYVENIIKSNKNYINLTVYFDKEDGEDISLEERVEHIKKLLYAGNYRI